MGRKGLVAYLERYGFPSVSLRLTPCRQDAECDNATDSLPLEFAAIPAKPEIGQSATGEFDPGLRPLPPEHLLGLSWTHFIELIRIDDVFTDTGRSARSNARSALFCTSVLASTDKESVILRASSQDSPASIATFLRDPYVLEFAGLAERPWYSEADLESALLDHLQTFLLEPGTGFCFEARQKRINIGNEHAKQLLVISLSDEKAWRLAKTCRRNSGRRA